MARITKNSRERRQIRVRKKLARNKGIPRLTVFRSNRFMWAQIIDDKKGHTLLALTTKTMPAGKTKKTKTEVAFALGEKIGREALQKGILYVRYDKGSYRYHGRVKALAQGARQAGLKF